MNNTIKEAAKLLEMQPLQVELLSSRALGVMVLEKLLKKGYKLESSDFGGFSFYQDD